MTILGYKIAYTAKAQDKQQPITKKHTAGYGFIITVIVTGILLFATQKMGFNYRNLLPGDAAVTEAAISSLVSDLSQGVHFGDAITACFTEIIESAQIS